MINTGLIIANLFAEVFGVSSPIYIPWGRTLSDFPTEEYKDVKLASREEVERRSWMGTPVLDSFILDGGTYKHYSDQGELTDVSMSDFLMPAATLVEFSRDMNVSKTKVLGAKGTVKEIYGINDWNINIRGFCLTDNSRDSQKTYEEQAHALVLFRDLADSISVTGDLFLNKGITAIVMENFQLSPVQGIPEMYSFSIQATSDQPYIQKV